MMAAVCKHVPSKSDIACCLAANLYLLSKRDQCSTRSSYCNDLQAAVPKQSTRTARLPNVLSCLLHLLKVRLCYQSNVLYPVLYASLTAG